MREELSRYQDLTECSIEELALTKEDFSKIEDLHFQEQKNDPSWKSRRVDDKYLKL